MKNKVNTFILSLLVFAFSFFLILLYGFPSHPPHLSYILMIAKTRPFVNCFRLPAHSLLPPKSLAFAD